MTKLPTCPYCDYVTTNTHCWNCGSQMIAGEKRNLLSGEEQATGWREPTLWGYRIYGEAGSQPQRKPKYKVV